MNSDDRDSRGERESTSGTSEPETLPSDASPGNGGESAPGRRDETIGPDDAAESGEHSPEVSGPTSESPATEDSGAAEIPVSEKSEPAPYYDDPYAEGAAAKELAPKPASVAPLAPPPPPPPPPPTDELDEEEGGMSRMSFLEHLEELRTRIIRSLGGLVLAYLACLVFAQQLFVMIKDPFDRAIETLPPELDARMVQSTAMEGFQLMYIKIPLLAAVFVAAPWLMYQAWAFIAPGLYKRERRWAAPFILSTAALFILGGIFGYFVALKFALAFLVGMSLEMGISAYVGVSSYFDNFVAIMLGLGVVFQMPIVIFFLTLLRITSPGFLLNNVRYAVLLIFILAAIITPTPDVVNMMIFAGPMILLFYVGVGASYLLVLHREERSLPWKWILLVVLGTALLIGGVLYFMHAEFGFQFVRQAPFFVRPPAP